MGNDTYLDGGHAGFEPGRRLRRPLISNYTIRPTNPKISFDELEDAILRAEHIYGNAMASSQLFCPKYTTMPTRPRFAEIT